MCNCVAGAGVGCAAHARCRSLLFWQAHLAVRNGTCSVNSLRELLLKLQVLLEITALLQLFMQLIACHRCDELLDKPVKAAALH